MDWEPRAGEVEPGEERIMIVMIDARELIEGNYIAELHILSNDPDDPDVVVNILFEIRGWVEMWVEWSEDAGYPDLMDWNRAYDELELNRNYEIGFRISCLGTGLLVVDEIQLRSAVFTVDGNGFELEPGESREMTVTFRSSERGEFEATMFIISNVEENWEWPITLHAAIPDHPPEVVSPIVDQELDEDFEAYTITNLNDVFDDPDGQQLSYSVEQDNQDVTVRILNPNRLWLQPVANRHGETTVVVTAEDPSGLTVSDTFTVTVHPVNDPPTPFSLFDPADGSTVFSYPEVVFSWQRSIDAVEDSTVTYALMLHYHGAEHWYRDFADTTFAVSREELADDPEQPTAVTWFVRASDGTDSIRSSGDDFTAIIAPLAVSQRMDQLPTELSLGPVYPNPFNDMVTVGFELPENAEVTLTIHDPLGRTVRSLEHGFFSAGRYRSFWDGRNDHRTKVSSGVYVCRLATPERVVIERLVMLR